MSYDLLCGDARSCLAGLPERSAHAVICSPPYYRLRSYLPADHPDKALELGQEAAPQEFVAGVVDVFAAAMRVLRDDGTLWVVIGDSWASHGRMVDDVVPSKAFLKGYKDGPSLGRLEGYTRKSLIGIPWRLAFGLQDAGWILRQDLIWHKRAPMPSSATDRFTPAHEYIFLLSKRPRYYFDQTAIAEPAAVGDHPRALFPRYRAPGQPEHTGLRTGEAGGTRNRRSVLTLGPEPLIGEDHYAAYPTRIPELALLAGTSAHGCCARCGAPWRRVVETERLLPASPSGARETRRWAEGPSLHVGDRTRRHERGWEPTCRCGTTETVPALVADPFMGSGSTGVAALRNGRRFWGCDLSERYVAMARRRIDASLCAANVLDRPRIRPVDGQLALSFDDVAPPMSR